METTQPTEKTVRRANALNLDVLTPPFLPRPLSLATRTNPPREIFRANTHAEIEAYLKGREDQTEQQAALIDAITAALENAIRTTDYLTKILQATQ